MILHKLLFFKLPYQYAASGDENGETVAELGESEKMDRLEQEVLNYPGFVSSYIQHFLVSCHAILRPIMLILSTCSCVLLKQVQIFSDIDDSI